jgi:hypothetical protein
MIPARMPCIVQPYLLHLCRTAQLPPEVTECVGMVSAPGIVDHNMLYYNFQVGQDAHNSALS